jgi:hypothetical protein
MPKVKTHHWAGVTLSMKNMFGVVPGSRYGWPKNVPFFTKVTLNDSPVSELIGESSLVNNGESRSRRPEVRRMLPPLIGVDSGAT